MNLNYRQKHEALVDFRAKISLEIAQGNGDKGKLTRTHKLLSRLYNGALTQQDEDDIWNIYFLMVTE